MNEFQDQLALAALFTWVWQGAKSVPWISWVGEHAPNVSRAFSAAFAALVAAGFTWTFSGDVVNGGTLTIQVPTLATMMEAGRLFVTQFAMQHSLFKVAFPARDKSNNSGENSNEGG